MKRLLLLLPALVFMLSMGANAQTKKGFFFGIEARTNDVSVVPTVGFIQPKFGYETRRFGIAATYVTNSKFQTSKSSMIGAELSATLFHVDAINVKAGVEGLYLIKERAAWKKWAVTPSLTVNIPILSHFEADFSVIGVYHQERYRDWSQKKRVIIDKWAFCNPGAKVGFKYKF